MVLDHVNDLNTDTPKVKCDGKTASPELLFGLDTQLFQLQLDKAPEGDEHLMGDGGQHFDNEVDLILVERSLPDGGSSADKLLSKEAFEAFLGTLPKENVFRLKGLVRLAESGQQHLYIVNHA